MVMLLFWAFILFFDDFQWFYCQWSSGCIYCHRTLNSRKHAILLVNFDRIDPMRIQLTHDNIFAIRGNYKASGGQADSFPPHRSQIPRFLINTIHSYTIIPPLTSIQIFPIWTHMDICRCRIRKFLVIFMPAFSRVWV